MDEPKKVNLLAGVKNRKTETPEEKILKQEKAKAEQDKTVDKILNVFNKREEEYSRVAGKRAIEDNQRRKEWDKTKTGYIRSSLFIPLVDNENYEEIRKSARGRLRVGYRHIFSYGLRELMKLAPEEIVDKLAEVDAEYKAQGLTIKG